MLPVPHNNKHLLDKKASEDARQYVYRVLHSCILAIILPPGKKINEANVADSLNVSRTPVHDSIIRLAREKLLRIIPKRGAYINKIDLDAFHQSVWMHLQMGTATLHSIFLNKRDSLDLDILNYILHQMDQDLLKNDLSEMPRYIFEFYHRLYLIAGDMNMVWDSLSQASAEYQRVLALAAKNPTVIRRFIYDLSSLTDALIDRNNDRACEIYRLHLNHIYQLIPIIKKQYPAYFE